MNKIIILLFILLSILNLIQSSDNDIVTLIINSNFKNNNYQPGELCGNNITNSCNNIQDSILFFNSISKPVDPTNNSSQIFQQLNLQLVDGTYTVQESWVNLFEFNITISPLTIGSRNVTFDGQNVKAPGGSNSLFSFKTPSADFNDSIINSFAEVNNITFINFQYPIVDISTNSSVTKVYFNWCNFIKYNGANSSLPMINANKDYIVEPDTNFLNPTTFIFLNNVDIHTSSLNIQSSLINGVACFISFNDSVVYQLSDMKSLLNLEFGYLQIQNSLFNYIFTEFGIFNTLNCYTLIDQSEFDNSQGTVLLQQANTVDNSRNFLFIISNSLFRNNTASIIGGGCIFVSHSGYQANSLTTHEISDSTFTDNYASTSGGVIYGQNVKVLIRDSTFTNNLASVNGGSVYFETDDYKTTTVNNMPEQLRFSNVTFYVPESPNTLNGVVLYIKGSVSTFFGCNFYQTLDNPKTFSCDESSLSFEQIPEDLTPYIYCLNCYDSSFNYDNICVSNGSSSSEHSATTTSTTGHHDGSGANNILKNNLSILFLIFSIFIVLLI